MSTKSVITNRDRDCLLCRTVSGGGLIGAGIYVAHHSKKFNKTPGKTIMFTIGGAIMLLGAARILNLPPFRHDNINKQT